MPKMEKGRPPENKRSRKPAHPVKREVSQEMKSFAESTMNELLGWYGYDKVDLQDSETADIRSHNGRARRHQVSVLKENSDPKPTVIESKLTSGSSASAKNGVKESTGFPLSPSSSSFSPHMKDLHSTHVVVPLIKPSAVDEQQNVQIVCVWCQKEGLKRYSLVMGSELKSFCSEKCFAMCRRAYFKRNKAQNENRHGDQSPPPPGQTEETPPQLLLKMNSNTRVCDWCKHVRHTKYLDLGAGDDRLQFCSTKCLNQYKMDIFYREARAALTTSGSSPSQPENENHPAGESETLLTPESWNNPMERDSKETVSPKVSTPVSSSCSSSSSVRASVLAQQKERESSASSQLQTGTPLPSTPPPHAVEQPWVIQKPPSFNRGAISAQPRNPGSSPHQRPSHTSPQVHTPSVRPIPPPQLFHPYPASMIPCAPTYPHPFPSLMPTLGLPCPQPTVLVPYPIIVPLPVPVPIPIPIPVNSGALGHPGVIRNHKDKEKTGRNAASVTPEDAPREHMSEDQEFIDSILVEHKVKTEQTSSPDPYSPAFSSHNFPILSAHQISPTPPLPEDQRQEVRERQVIQRAICRVKQEGEIEFDLSKETEVEQENGWSRNGDEDDLIAQQMSTKAYTGTLKHTSSSVPENASSPVDSPNARASIILQKALNTTSVVTPTSSILLNNTAATSNSVHSVYSSTCIATVQSDPEQRTSSGQNSSPLPVSEDVKENVSGGREPVLNRSLAAEQTDCQTDQSEENRGGAVDNDALAADEHAYARSIPPKLREKNAHTITLATAHTLSHMVTHSWDKSSHMHAPAFEQSGVHTEIEPALKRRCLRIRDQNK
ncbi:sine oculis-binding protein homolog B-like isoform X1 [Hemibagrus wyckioides]|uniref:sine oculis-binding protein homolog B-like isoform X1 n=2 Tax=Hemibagrus wyckioides TaxID=337641 RepID=UPI00266C88B8|nr:sine oculis-binding protein homolog B-like isoform X1 [Hemibagrus wyckioides]